MCQDLPGGAGNCCIGGQKGILANSGSCSTTGAAPCVNGKGLRLLHSIHHLEACICCYSPKRSRGEHAVSFPSCFLVGFPCWYTYPAKPMPLACVLASTDFTPAPVETRAPVAGELSLEIFCRR